MTDKRRQLDAELDELTEAALPTFEAFAELGRNITHEFDTEPNLEHRKQQAATRKEIEDAAGITDSVDARITTDFGGPRPCHLCHEQARADNIVLILELPVTDYTSGVSPPIFTAGTYVAVTVLELCPLHHNRLLTAWRNRADTFLEFAGHRVLAVNPPQINPDEVLKIGQPNYDPNGGAA